MKTRNRRFLLIALLCLAAGGGRNALAGTIAVTSTADDGPGSLRQALVLASDGDTINIVAKGTITLTSGELIVDKSVIIRGPGATKLSISGNGTSRVFHVTPNTIATISGLKIANGSVSTAFGAFLSTAGGGIFSDHADLSVSNCIISGNSARCGGGIFSNSQFGGSAALTISSTTLRDNSASFAGGGIFSGGGFANTGDSGDAILRINNSLLSNNAAARYGGGIFNDGFSGTATLTLNNSTISALSNPLHLQPPGAGIYNNGDSGVATVTLTNSTVTVNPPEFGDEIDSGIYNDGTASVSPGSATLTLTDSAFEGGRIVNDGSGGSAIATINNSTFSGNAGFGNLGGSATVNNSTFRGAGIANQFGTATLNNSTVSENSGYVGIYNLGGTFTLNNSIIHNNSSNYIGGIHNECGTLTLNNSAVSNNSGFYGGIGNLCLQSGGHTGAVTLNSSTVSNNSGDIGEIFNYGGPGATATFTVSNSTVSGSSRITIYTSGVEDGSGLLVLRNSTVSNNANLQGVFLSAIQNISFNGGSSTVEIANTILNAAVPGFNIGSSGTVVSHGYNLSSDSAGGLLNGPGDIINTNPMLGPLKNNGGPTKTHALLLNSPAIDAGDPNFNPNAFVPPLLYDQRDGPGFRRVVNGRVDIGAFESRHP